MKFLCLLLLVFAGCKTIAPTNEDKINTLKTPIVVVAVLKPKPNEIIISMATLRGAEGKHVVLKRAHDIVRCYEPGDTLR